MIRRDVEEKGACWHTGVLCIREYFVAAEKEPEACANGIAQLVEEGYDDTTGIYADI